MAAALLCSAGQALAAETAAQGQDAAQAPDDQPADETGAIVVTARRVNENVQDVPVAVTAVSGETIAQLAITDLRQVNGLTPNLFIQTNAGQALGGSIKLRGQQNPADQITFDPAVAVYIDDIYLPRENGLGAVTLDIESIQVLNGPQGTLFGKNATGGALIFTSRRPELDAVGGYATVGVGNYDTRQLTGVLNLPLVTDKLAIRVAGTMDTSGGFGTDSAGRATGARKNSSFRAQMLFEPGDALSVRLIAERTDLQTDVQMIRPTRVYPYSAANPPPGSAPLGLRAVAAALSLPQTPAGFEAARNALAAQAAATGFYDTPTNRVQFHNLSWTTFSGDIRYEINDAITVRSITGYRKLDQRQNQDNDSFTFNIVDNHTFNIPISKSTDESFFSQELQLIGTLDRFDWIVGGYFAKTDGTEVNVSGSLGIINPTAPVFFDGDAKSRTLGVFAQGTYAVLDNLNVTGGVRYTEETKELVSRNRNAVTCLVPVALRSTAGGCISVPIKDTFNDVSYLASIDWKPVEELMIYARTGRGFRGGGQNLRGGSAATFVEFKPEVVVDYEIGLKFEGFDRALTTNIALFTSDLKNAQRNVFITLPDNSVTTVTTNAASATVKGIELDAIVRPFDGSTIRFTAGYLDAQYNEFRDLTGDRTGESFGVPEFTYSITATQDVPVGNDNLRALINWTWIDDVQFVPAGTGLTDRLSTKQPAFGQLNARLTYTIDALDADVSIWGRNLTDKKFITGAVSFQQAGNFGFDVGYAGRPLEFGIDVTMRFGS
jgi:iron complex outermembrane receptor protein